MEVEVGGRALPAGQLVSICYASANRDESEFDHADELRLDRKPNRHVAFGHGPHTCVGAPMARLVLQIGLECVVDRCASLALAAVRSPLDESVWPRCSRATTRWSCSAGSEAERFAECHRSLAVTIGSSLS